MFFTSISEHIFVQKITGDHVEAFTVRWKNPLLNLYSAMCYIYSNPIPTKIIVNLQS